MAKVEYNRQTVCLEDLEVGTGTVDQLRGGDTVTLTQINAGNLPFDETRDLVEAVEDAEQAAVDAGNSATSAANSAQSASDSANAAEVSALSAANSAQNASESADNAQDVYEDFQGTYYGKLPADPTEDPNGDPVEEGDLYFNTTIKRLRVYEGSVWIDAGSAVNGLATYDPFIATAGQTLFTGLSYDVGFVLVTRQGRVLPQSSYVAIDGSTLTLNDPCNAGDDILIISFGVFSDGGLGNLEDRVEQNEQDIATNTNSINTNTNNISNLTITVGNNTTGINNNSSAISANTLTIGQNTTAINGLQTNITNIENNIVIIEGDITDLENGLASASGSITQNAIDINALEVSFFGLDSRVTDIENGEIMYDRLKLEPQNTTPSYIESSIFYDNMTKSLSVFTDIPEFTHNLGQEVVIRVINKTGATIENGKPVRQNGVDITTNLPLAALAIANNFTNSRVIGIATHDIPNNEEGFVTNFGLVSDVDTSGIPAGSVIYLSDTVPGGFTTTAPNIVTRIGGVVIEDATVGRIFAKPSSNMALPIILSFLQGQTSPIYNLTATPTEIANYAIAENSVIVGNTVTGEIVIPFDGDYKFTVTLNAVANEEEEKLFFEIYDKTNNNVLWEYTKETGRSSTPGAVQVAMSFTVPINILADNTTTVLRCYTDGTAVELNISRLSFSAESLKVRN